MLSTRRFNARGFAAAIMLVVLVPMSMAGAKPPSESGSGGCGTSAQPSGKDRCEESGGSDTRGLRPPIAAVDAAPGRIARAQAALAATGLAGVVAMSIVALLLLCIGTLTVLKTRDRSTR